MLNKGTDIQVGYIKSDVDKHLGWANIMLLSVSAVLISSEPAHYASREVVLIRETLFNLNIPDLIF